MARPRKALELHKVEGTFRRDRHSKRAPGRVKKLSCPKELDGRAREVWQRLSRTLKDRTTESDRTSFRLLVEGIVEFEGLSEHLRESGMTYERIGTNGEPYIAIRPEVHIRRDCWTRISKLMSKFGLTPSDRQTLGLKEEKPLDEIDKRKPKDWL